MFILDKEKKIVAKSLYISQIEELLDRLQGVKDAPILFPREEEKKEEEKERAEEKAQTH